MSGAFSTVPREFDIKPLVPSRESLLLLQHSALGVWAIWHLCLVSSQMKSRAKSIKEKLKENGFFFQRRRSHPKHADLGREIAYCLFCSGTLWYLYLELVPCGIVAILYTKEEFSFLSNLAISTLWMSLCVHLCPMCPQSDFEKIRFFMWPIWKW
jgi:hypothetical protein